MAADLLEQGGEKAIEVIGTIVIVVAAVLGTLAILGGSLIDVLGLIA